MTKSQNTKSEHNCIKQNEKSFTQKDLSLTELWQKGELPDGWYYCYVNNEEYKKLYYDGDCFELEDAETKNYYFFLPKDSENIIILAPVPSYDEWKKAYECVVSENEEIITLKYLLKDCREMLKKSITYQCMDRGNHYIKKIENDIYEPILAKIDEVLK